MGWIVLFIGAAALFGGIAAVRGRRRSGPGPAYRAGPRADPAERPHRRVMHYRASGALPRWDP